MAVSCVQPLHQSKHLVSVLFSWSITHARQRRTHLPPLANIKYPFMPRCLSKMCFRHFSSVDIALSLNLPLPLLLLPNPRQPKLIPLPKHSQRIPPLNLRHLSPIIDAAQRPILIHDDGTEVIEFDGVAVYVERGSWFGCGGGGGIGEGEWFG
jgi:hypothetical protein